MVLAFHSLALYAQAPGAPLDEALTLIKAGKLQAAERAIDAHLATPDSDPRALYWKAYVEFKTSRYAASAATARKYLADHPEAAAARKILGLDLFMLGDSAGAENELTQAVEALPKDSEVRYFLGRVQFERQNMVGALESFKRVLALEPQSVRGHNHLGQTYEGLGQFSEAEAAYRRAIEIDQAAPNRSEWPYFNLGVLLNNGGNSADGIRYLEDALRINPKFTDARVKHAIALAALQRTEEAEKELLTLLKEEPVHAGAHYQLGRLYLKMRKPDKAQQHLALFEKFRKK